MARRLIIDDRTGVLYEDFTGRRIASLGELLNAEAGATETVEVFSVAVNPQTRAVTANTILTANVSLDLGVPRAKPTGGKLTVTYGSDTSGEIPIETLTAETLSSALNRLDAMETAGGCDVWRAAEDDSELSFYVRLHNNGAPGTNPSFDCDGATPPAIGEVTVVKAGASSERALWLVNIAEKPVASIAESAWSTVTSGSFGGLTASLALNGAGLIAHLSKENPGELTLTVKNSSSVLYRGTVDALSSVDPTDLNGSAILSIFPRIVTSTSNPAVTDDSGDGYAVGTLWINTTADTYFVLADATAGAAVWVSHLHLTGGTMTGAIAMGSNKITGLADGTASADAINKGQLDGLIDSAPAALNTLNELAAALGDDVNFSTTVATNIATKLPLAGGTMTGALNTLDINLTDSDVAHGITNVAATDAYGHLSTIHGTQGGLYINGISDQESADARSLALRGICNDTHTDTVPTVEIIGAKRSGTTVQALADAETVLTVANHTSTLLTVLGSGKVGIGIAVPTKKLHIYEAAAHVSAMVGSDAAYNATLYFGEPNTGIYRPAGTTDLRLYQGSADVLSIKGGKIGINTTAPSSLLDVRGAAGYPGILTLSTAETSVVASNQLGRIDFVAPLESGGTDAILVGASITALAVSEFTSISNTTDLIFSTAISETATEKMRLTSAGNLLVENIGVVGGASTAILDQVVFKAGCAWNAITERQGRASAFSFFDGFPAVRTSSGPSVIWGYGAGQHMDSAYYLGWTPASPNGTADTKLYRDDIGILAQRNNGAAQEFRIYQTWTDASNYERGFSRWNLSTYTLGTESAGTGTNRDLKLWAHGGTRVLFTSGQAIFIDHVRANVSNTQDLGGLTREWRTGYFGTSVIIQADAGNAGLLELNTEELTVVDGDVLGKISFGAPLESSGTDAILDGAAIWAEADDTFANDNNKTSLVFATGASEVAAEKMRLTSAGNLILDGSLLVHGSKEIRGGASSTAFWRWSVDGGGNPTLIDGNYRGWASNSNLNGVVVNDIRLYRDAAGILAQRNNGAAQEFRIYSDLGDPAGNYERGSFAMDTSGDLTIATEAGGTGTVGKINLDGTVVVDGLTQLKVYTVSALPAQPIPAGSRAFVSDSNAAWGYAIVGATVAAGGSYLVPVHSDGTYWKCG